MTDYNRFVSYIYKYQNNVKMQHIGYARMEIKVDAHSVYIHLNHYEIPKNYVCKAYLVYRSEGFLHGISIGEIKVNAKTGELFYENKEKYIRETKKTLQEMAGLIITDGSVYFFASCWDDGSIDFSKFKIISKNESVQNTIFQNISPLKISSPEMNPQNISQGSIEKETKKDYSWFEKIAEMKGIDLNEGNKTMDCTMHLSLQDLGMLPMQFWIYASHGFLLSSYGKYQDLVLIKDMDDHYYLGIPGSGSEEEQVIASAYGLKDFRYINDEQTADYGYWCLLLSLLL